MKKVGLCCLDQDPRTTTTLGIYHYTQNLIAALARSPDPGLQLLIWGSAANVADFTPANLPPWMTVQCLPGSYGRGPRRLWADHVLSARLPEQARVDAVHYPKGWLPCCGPRGVKTMVTLHDTIVQYYRQHHPEFGSSAKWRYFDWILRRSARRAERIVTPSRASAAEITALIPGSSAKISVVHTGVITPAPVTDSPRGDDILVLGSRAPHKATAQTLNLLDAHARTSSIRSRVVVTGLESWSELSGSAPPAHIELRCEGRVSDARMAELMRTCRLLVFLSEIEGFGLPLLEAYSALTPVCYRKASSMAEVLDGIPGGWDGSEPGGFFKAMNEALSLSRHQITDIRAGLHTKYNSERMAALTLAVYRDVLGM